MHPVKKDFGLMARQKVPEKRRYISSVFNAVTGLKTFHRATYPYLKSAQQGFCFAEKFFACHAV